VRSTVIAMFEDEELDEWLDRLRMVGDPEVDALIAAYMLTAVVDVDGDGVDDLRPKTMFRNMLTRPVGSEQHPRVVRDYFAQPMLLPSWADPEKIRTGQELFWTYAPQFGLGLWLASIPSGYAGARDAIVLGESVRCVSEPKARFLETGQFVIDVMTPGQLVSPTNPCEAAGIGARDIGHVRLVHGLARYLIKERQDLTDPDFTWTPDMGEPVNQMALLATQFTFGVVGIEALGKFGVQLTADEKDAYIHLWNVIGHLLGIRLPDVDPDEEPLDLETSQRIWNRIKEREYDTSPQGVELTQAAVKAMQEMMPGRLLDGFPATGIRHMIGEHTANMLGVPPADWTRSLFWPMLAANRIAMRVNRHIPVGRPMSQWMGKAVFRNFVALESGRQGERPSFEIDDELRKRLVLKTRQERAAAVRAQVVRLKPTRSASRRTGSNP
jgi:ER-bound oxygenase mpaB/B'/Rubber oxygenase, catalytic domain